MLVNQATRRGIFMIWGRPSKSKFMESRSPAGQAGIWSDGDPLLRTKRMFERRRSSVKRDFERGADRTLASRLRTQR